jgi:hypothetical protein
MAAEASMTAVVWPAVFAGATIIAALALLLVALGVGFGLSAISPWTSTTSPTTLGAAAIAWLVTTQVVACSLGGYLAGRLRTRWTATHADEVYFRDTAHGFLAWGLAWVSSAALLATAVATLAGHPPTSPTRAGLAEQYYADALFRHSTSLVVPDATRAEGATVLERVLTLPDESAADEQYLARLVGTATGLSDAAATTQVTDVVTRARLHLDVVRRTSARASFWIFVALLAGAYCASHAATVGGRRRDHLPAA